MKKSICYFFSTQLRQIWSVPVLDGSIFDANLNQMSAGPRSQAAENDPTCTSRIPETLEKWKDRIKALPLEILQLV